MNHQVNIILDGIAVRVPADATLAAALLSIGTTDFRHDSTGQPRAPLCGMGTCFECRVSIDGVAESRACLVMVQEGMIVETAR